MKKSLVGGQVFLLIFELQWQTQAAYQFKHYWRISLAKIYSRHGTLVKSTTCSDQGGKPICRTTKNDCHAFRSRGCQRSQLIVPMVLILPRKSCLPLPTKFHLQRSRSMDQEWGQRHRNPRRIGQNAVRYSFVWRTMDLSRSWVGRGLEEWSWERRVHYLLCKVFRYEYW